MACIWHNYTKIQLPTYVQHGPNVDNAAAALSRPADQHDDDHAYGADQDEGQQRSETAPHQLAGGCWDRSAAVVGLDAWAFGPEACWAAPAGGGGRM